MYVRCLRIHAGNWKTRPRLCGSLNLMKRKAAPFTTLVYRRTCHKAAIPTHHSVSLCIFSVPNIIISTHVVGAFEMQEISVCHNHTFILHTYYAPRHPSVSTASPRCARTHVFIHSLVSQPPDHNNSHQQCVLSVSTSHSRQRNATQHNAFTNHHRGHGPTMPPEALHYVRRVASV